MFVNIVASMNFKIEVDVTGSGASGTQDIRWYVGKGSFSDTNVTNTFRGVGGNTTLTTSFEEVYRMLITDDANWADSCSWSGAATQENYEVEPAFAADGPNTVLITGDTSSNSANTSFFACQADITKSCVVTTTLRMEDEGEVSLDGTYTWTPTLRKSGYPDFVGAEEHSGVVSSVLINQGFCFVAGTLVLLEGNTTKNIENMVVGDKVIGQDGVINEVKELIANAKTDAVIYTINDNIQTTAPHPFLTTTGWKAINNEIAAGLHPSLNITELTVGDFIVTIANNGTVSSEEITTITNATQDVTVYNLDVTDSPAGNDTYVVNNYVVHNK
jgi:hypothetical protein